MFGRLLRVSGTVLVIAVAFVTPVLATATPAGADTVVDGCTIVSSPTATNFTNCPGADLSGASLSGVDLSYANLAGAHFVDCNEEFFFFASCDGADLSGANFTDANLSNASFFQWEYLHPARIVSGSADLSGSTLSGADLSGSDLTGVDLTGATLTGATLAGTQLAFTNLTNADLSDANLTEATFTNCEIFGDCQSGGTLTNANLTDAILTGVDFTGTLLIPSDLRVLGTTNGAVVTWPMQSLPGATAGSCTIPPGSTVAAGYNATVTCQVVDDFGNIATGTFTLWVYPTGCAKLAHCDFHGTTLSEFNMSGDDLMQANFKEVSFYSSNLSGADLMQANLESATLDGDNLSGADLMQAALKGANLTSVDLTGANLSAANLSGVVWSKTTCPDGTNSDNDGGTCVGHL